MKSCRTCRFILALKDRQHRPFTRRAGAQSALGYMEMEYVFIASRRVPEVPDLGTRGMER